MEKDLNIYNNLCSMADIDKLVSSGIYLFVSCHQNPTRSIVPKIDLKPTRCQMSDKVFKDKYYLDGLNGVFSIQTMRALLGKHLILLDENNNKLGNLNKNLGTIKNPSVNLYVDLGNSQRDYNEQISYITEMSEKITELYNLMNQLKK